MTPPQDSVSDVERAISFMRHHGLCAIIGGYDYCSCGRDEAEEKLLAALAVPINKIGEDAKAQALVRDLDRQASAIYDDVSQSDLWATLIAARDTIRRLSTNTDKGVSNEK